MYPNYTNTTIFLIINLLILLVSFIYNKKIYKYYGYISLPFLFNLFFFFFYIIVHTYVVFSNNTYLYYINTRKPQFIIYATIIVTLCNLFFLIGSILPSFFKRKVLNKFIPIRIFTGKKMFSLGLTLFLIGIISKLIYFSILGHGNLLAYIKTYYSIQLSMASTGGGFELYLHFIFVLIPIGADILLIHMLLYKRFCKLTILILIIALLSFITTRLSLITILMQYIIIICLYRPKILKKLPILTVSIILPIIFSIVLGVGIYRESTNNKILKDINPAFFILGANHGMRAINDVMEYNISFQKHYHGLSMLLPIIQKPIPRRIWKDKALNTGAIYTKTMDPGAIENGFAIAPGLCTDAYINFGYLGTLIFFMLIGCILFLVQNYLLRLFFYNKLQIFYPVLIAILGSHCLYLRGEDVSLIVVKTFYYIFMLLLIFLKVRIVYKK